MRVKYKPWAKDYIKDKDNIFINSYIENMEMLDQLLNDFSKVYMEIGCGKGKFIYENAQKNPDILYIGVEKQASVIINAAQKQEEKPLNNLKFFYGDIFSLKENNILVNKLDKIFLNFSDPWPKKRHEKRKLTFIKFLDLYVSLLKDSSTIELKTDNDQLFEYSLISFSNHGKWIFNDVYLDLHSMEEINNITTEYEEKFSEKGYKIKYLNVKKM